MDIPISWLEQYVPVTVPPRELAHRLTMAGTEVGGIREIGADWDREKVLVGLVAKVDPHPNADRLTLPTVDLGDGESATVVCGAPNVAAGQKIAFAREGARLFSTRSGKVEPLRPANIRGVRSLGMVCSERELGLGDDHDGILVLDDAAPLGMPLADYLGDVILELELTPNRPDCLSVLGVAHEVAAVTGASVAEPDLAYPEEGGPIEERVTVEIADPDLCSRYAAALIEEVKVGTSPRWLQDALERAGMRPINNVVDVTNYVMLEYGQPLHAFDFEFIRERKIVVRAARPGEALRTLDGEVRKLQPPMLAIADAHDAIALAGVMGGADSEVRESTTTVLIESANFDPVNTRRTAAALRLSTEASYRFERGIRADLVPRALRGATQLMLQLAGGSAARGIVDSHPRRTEPPALRLTGQRIERVLGVEFASDQVKQVLTSLGFEVSDVPFSQSGSATPERAKDGSVWVKAPYWRSDITIEEDLVEELARIAGYDSIPTTMLAARLPHHTPQTARDLRERVRDEVASAGVQEIISYPLIDRDTLVAVGGIGGIDGIEEPLEIANPMSSDMRHLRTSLRASVLRTLESNRRVARGEGFRLFEIGRVYLPKEEAKECDLPDEREMLVGAFSGPRSVPSWLASEGQMDFFDAKGVLEAMFTGIGVSAEYGPSTDPALHPGKTAEITVGARRIGVVGEVHPSVLERFDLDEGPVAIFEVDVDALHDALPGDTGGYAGVSRYPESERDLALIVDDAVSSARIQAIIEAHRLVKRSSPFDLYRGEQVQAGKKSIGYRVVFQSDKSTLTADQVNWAEEQILGQLRKELGAELRE